MPALCNCTEVEWLRFVSIVLLLCCRVMLHGVGLCCRLIHCSRHNAYELIFESALRLLPVSISQVHGR